MQTNKGEKLAQQILPKLGFKNLKKKRFVDFSANYHGKPVLIEVKYRRHLTGNAFFGNCSA